MHPNALRSALLALAVGAGCAVAADTAPTVPAATADVAAVHQGTLHQALFGIAFDGQSGLAVGAAGQILASSDGGKNWAAAGQPATPLALLGTSLRGGHRIAVGQQGLILSAGTDGVWKKVDSGVDARLFSVGVNAQGLAVAVGAFGTVLKSDDGGVTWSRLPIDWSANVEPGIEPHVYAVQVDDDGTITLAGEFGLILRSADAGGNWQVAHKSDISLFALQLRADGIGYAVGQSGTILRSSDHGASWADVASGSNAILLGVHSSAQGKVVVSGMRDALQSDDDGVNWRRLGSADFGTAWYQGVAAAEGATDAIVVGHSGRIVRVGH